MMSSTSGQLDIAPLYELTEDALVEQGQPTPSATLAVQATRGG